MAKLKTLEDVLYEELNDIYSAEEQILKALPKMAEKASSTVLREAFTEHQKETEEQINRLQQVAEMVECKLGGKTCKAMKGIIAEGEELIKEYKSSELLDALLISAAQRVEHYEIAAYGTARTLCEQLGYTDAVDLLQETLDEESATDEKLTTISEEEILPTCPTSEDEAADSDEESTSASRR